MPKEIESSGENMFTPGAKAIKIKFNFTNTDWTKKHFFSAAAPRTRTSGPFRVSKCKFVVTLLRAQGILPYHNPKIQLNTEH